MKLKFLATFLIVILSATGTPTPANAGQFQSGKWLVGVCTESVLSPDYLQKMTACNAYIQGAYDSFDMARLRSKKPECVPAGTSSNAVREMVISFLQRHPEKHEFTASVSMALDGRGLASVRRDNVSHDPIQVRLSALCTGENKWD